MELLQRNSWIFGWGYVSNKPLEGFEYHSTIRFLQTGRFQEEQDTVLRLKIITKTGGTFQPFLFPQKIILKDVWEYGLRV
jgi:hypothetical protein